MYLIKSCPRCDKGDLFEDRDEYGSYAQCFQCGYVEYPEAVLPLEQAKAEQLNRRGRR
ncbi:MAG: hypothetical protein P3T54_07130 [Dehalogenimonas sp.]|jgi:ribosomal protein S27AE|uniref:Uncharacterized protein n=1 Tax=Candidatus Dehalogenimonas loeffleri TaxID=3127115 RepID=A0ABZ2J8E2_9CHLR|nr:hypothetical protein [Dehalogenimonas sp.]